MDYCTPSVLGDIFDIGESIPHGRFSMMPKVLGSTGDPVALTLDERYTNILIFGGASGRKMELEYTNHSKSDLSATTHGNRGRSIGQWKIQQHWLEWSNSNGKKRVISEVGW